MKISTTPQPARILPDMTTTAATLLNPTAPALSRARALIALIFQLLFKPDARAQIEQLCAEAEEMFAAYLLEAAIKQSGRSDISTDTHEAYVIWRGATLDFGIRLKPGAIHPFHRIIAKRWRAILLGKYRRMLARRQNFSRKLHKIARQLNARRAGIPAVRHAAHARFTFTTPNLTLVPP